jgi:hypothetical protein
VGSYQHPNECYVSVKGKFCLRDRQFFPKGTLCYVHISTRLNLGISLLQHYYCLFVKGVETCHIKFYIHWDCVYSLHVPYVRKSGCTSRVETLMHTFVLNRVQYVKMHSFLILSFHDSIIISSQRRCNMGTEKNYRNIV